jgi:hypothetical protein
MIQPRVARQILTDPLDKAPLGLVAVGDLYGAYATRVRPEQKLSSRTYGERTRERSPSFPALERTDQRHAGGFGKGQRPWLRWDGRVIDGEPYDLPAPPQEGRYGRLPDGAPTERSSIEATAAPITTVEDAQGQSARRSLLFLKYNSPLAQGYTSAIGQTNKLFHNVVY